MSYYFKQDEIRYSDTWTLGAGEFASKHALASSLLGMRVVCYGSVTMLV